LEKSVADIRPTTELELGREQVIFAGRLAQTNWSIGKALVVAAGAVGYWYMMTSRTLP
jgi:hypothetical protein